MTVLMRHRGIGCRLFCVVCLLQLEPAAAFSDQPDTLISNPRYERILVTVSVDDPTLESRRAALAKAHKEALFVWLESQLDTIENSTRHYFDTRVDQYIVTTEVLKETRLAFKAELEVEVYLDHDKLRFDAASLLYPKRPVPASVIMLMGQEFVNGGYTTRMNDIAPAMLDTLFAENGFRVKTQAELDAVYSHEDILQCIRGGSDSAAQLARALQMDIAILGDVRTGILEEESATGMVKAFADILIIRAADGLLLDRLQSEAIVAGEDLAIVSKVAAEDAMFKIQQRVLVAAALGMLNDTPDQWTHCVIRGVNVKRISSEILQYLKLKSTVDSVNLLHRDRNELIFDLAYSGKTSALIDALGKQDGDSFWLEPVKIVKGEMLLNLQWQE